MNLKNNIRKVTPYITGEQPKVEGIIKLNTNENPYPPSYNVIKDMVYKLKSKHDLLKLYPDTNSDILRHKIAMEYGVKDKQVFVGIGSNDVISTIYMTFFNSELPILFPDITYSFYNVWANMYRVTFKTVPLDSDFRINSDDYKIPNGGIIFPNPNAPTGIFEKLETIEDIVKSNPNSVVVIDEAYIDFGGESCLPLIEKYDNLIVVQTFSKSRSLAGVRIGFAIGNENLIKHLNEVKFSINPYTINIITNFIGIKTIEDKDYFRNIVGKVIKTREDTKKSLTELGFTFTNSMGNFIFAKHKIVSGNEIFEKLKERNIYVRYWNKPRIDEYLRITIGTDEQMETLIHALKEIVS